MKTEYNHIPPEVLKALADVLTEGAKRKSEGDVKLRGPRGWRKMYEADPEGTINLYMDSLFRHWEEYRAGSKQDKVTKAHPLDHLLANGVILLDCELMNDKQNPRENERHTDEPGEPFDFSHGADWIRVRQ
jgi:hypothetical protein